MIRIIIDTREQTPWAFDAGNAQTEIGTIKTGDYALFGDADNFAIERKSLNDFLGTISSGWERFMREIGRMDNFVAKVIIVEGDYEQVCFQEIEGEIKPPQHDHYRLYPAFINKRIAELSLMGVAVIFAGNSEYASALALAIFRERAKEIDDETRS
ncbi:MAG: hypothetical protein M0P69_13845 [Bacteroidales bacterium]|nr:hypothetical protein [Bacteroidales bacterium]